MQNFKYRFFFNGDYYLGNSVDDLASKISKDPNNNISFTQAVVVVNKGVIPVAKKVADEILVKHNKKHRKGLTVDQMASGAAAILKQSVGYTETQTVINERADICFNCPMRTQASICKACGQGAKITRLVNKVKNWFGKGIKIPSGLEQDYCLACECSLAMLLPAPLDQIDESTKNDPDRPSNCWMKQ